MKELINSYQNKHYLDLGEGKFSPITSISIGIALDYCKLTQSSKYPLFLSFPEKSSAALWLSVAILRNYFAGDYLDTAIRSITFKGREKVQIYSCIAEVVSATDEEIVLMFKDRIEVSIKKKHWSNISNAPKNRSLNLYKRYVENKQKYADSRNPISKILEPNESVVINNNNLDSKVLLISGRGNVHVFKDLLNRTFIYNEPLAKTFSLDRNLIIAQDLKPYMELCRSDYPVRFDNFKRQLNKLIVFVQEEELKYLLTELHTKLSVEKCVTPEFDTEFRDFVDEYLELIPNLKFIYNSYPGIKEVIAPKLRAVIINDIRQIEEYDNTISAFLARDIPVILISNRNVLTLKDLELYKQLSTEKSHYYRINWNRTKIDALMKCETNANYIDAELWRKCKRHAKQKINIEVCPEHDLDKMLSKLIVWIKELDDFEVLQKAFYSYLYPAIYALKNSNGSNELVKNLICQFKEIFESVEHLIQQKDIVNDFNKTIFLTMNFDVNTKSYSLDENIFSSNTLLFNSDKRLNIPLDISYVNIPSSDTDEIVFTGYPYNEYFGKNLLDATCVNFVPNVKIKCWPNEAMLTHAYLRRRIKAGYFLDNLQKLSYFKERYLIQSEDSIEQEIDSYLTINKPNLQILIEEEPMEYLHTFKYKGYRTDIEGEGTFTSKSNILNFNDGTFMFLPIGSSVLAQIEDHSGKQKVRKLNIDNLKLGDKVFVPIKDRGVYRKISKTNQHIEQCFQQLELWKECLKKLFKECDENIELLERYLKDVKKENEFISGNPVKSSIQRWLFDEEMISPDIDNLRIILKAAEVEGLEVKLMEMEIAYKSVSSFTIGLSSTIKKNITNQLASILNDVSFFSIKVENVEIVVDVKHISSVDKNEIEVDYRNTRKFLC